MGHITTYEDRIRMIELSKIGFTDAEIAKKMNISYWTVRKWRRRGFGNPDDGLVSKLGRPYKGRLSSFSVQLRKELRSMRHSHPGWGAKTLLAELLKGNDWSSQRLPGVTSINLFLKEEDLTRPYQHRSQLPQPAYHEAKKAHEQWEMDARGKEYVPDVGVIMLIDMNDRYSHTRLLSFPCWVGQHRIQRHPNTDDYQVSLRLAFTDWGLPQQLGVDRESVFHDNDTASPFPTRLHLWLIALGVELCFGRKHTPTDQGITERSHQLWAKQVIEGQRFSNWEVLFRELYQRRDFLNYHLPCSTTNNLPPLIAFPEAKYSGRFYHPQQEEQLMQMQRVENYLAQGEWFRRVSKDGNISLGGKVHYLTTRWKRQEVNIIFDPILKKMTATNINNQEHILFPLKGFDKKDLIGENGALANIPNLQLNLPFSWNEIRLFPLINPRGTTFVNKRGTT